MNIEDALKKYLQSKGPKVKDKIIIEKAQGNADAVINVIFKLINEEIDTMTEEKALDRVVEVLNYIELILNDCERINKKLLIRKLQKLSQKFDIILFEQKKKFSNINKIQSEFNKVERKIEELLKSTEKKDSKKYEFIRYLINETKNINYVEYSINKMPHLINARDKDEISLFRNLVKRYIENVEIYDEENLMYYGNIISLIMSKKNFTLNTKDREESLSDINNCVNKISNNKKDKRRLKQKLEYLNKLLSIIKSVDKRRECIKNVADKYKIKINFDNDIIEQAQLVKNPMEGEISDREIISDYVLSMDGDGACEIDDALSCRKLPNGNYLLGVHIASVLSYFPYESEVIQEALERNRSIYLRKEYQLENKESIKTIPIFPFDFSADKASLIENEPRFTRSYIFEIDENGEVVNERFTKSIIRNNKQATYYEIDKIMKNGTNDIELQTTINNLIEVTKRLDNKYKNSSELYERLKENTDDYYELRVNKFGSQNIVYQAMTLTSNRVAEFFARNNYPCLKRVHYINDANDEKLEAMINNLTKTYGGEGFKVLYQLIEGISSKGWYATEGPHQGIGVEHYCHCTSELRRAADIVIEHALEICYDKTPTQTELDDLKEEIEFRANQINSKQNLEEWFVKELQKSYRIR